MQKQYKKIWLLCIAALLMMQTNLFAQPDPLTQARGHAARKEYKQAITLYKKVYNQNPTIREVYDEYLDLLIANEDFKEAERIAREQLQIRANSPVFLIDLGRVYLADGKEKKAEDAFNQALDNINGDDVVTQQMAAAFIEIKRDDYAIETYERASKLLRNPVIYGNALARLYEKTGAIDKAVLSLLVAGPMMRGGIEETKSTLLEFLGTDEKKLRMGQKALIKKINEQPENPYYAELLTWLYTQRDDWEGAMIQTRALDDRYREHGERMMDFARAAVREKKYEFAIKAYDAVIEKGSELPFYTIAKNERLTALFRQLKENVAFTAEEVAALAKDYESFLAEYPQYYTTQTLRDYAELEARYAHNPAKALQLLKKAISQPMARKDFIGWTKLQMGDYHILSGSSWEAALLFMQVDKDFREDMLGEEARFRNGKLSYYQGDFAYAQSQLSVLKQSTSELIANDALYLSVLITENIPPDSNYVPLRRFAYADLLMFQNKDEEAAALLDSINTAFPEHPLSDDILLQRAKLALKHHDYAKSLAYLEEIHTKHGDDVLGDDAMMKTAEIYEHYLHKPTEAQRFYEDLIINYPGSTYVQIARKRLYDMKEAGQAAP